jgi:hypothetical protein
MEETNEIERSSVAGDGLQGIKQRLQDWRSQRKLGEHIPAPLWAAAVDAAREHGVYRVAIELHLDYAGLKRRVERLGATPPRGQVAPQFVELMATAAPPPPTPPAPAAAAAERHECVVEMENARGTKMRVQLNGPGVAALAGLCSSFWGA